MNIRQYKTSDLEQIARLFYETVHAINIKDYTEQQVNVWATGNINLKQWDNSFLRHLTYVAIEDDLIIGFGDIDETGYLDRLYVHKDFQRQGVATAICNRLENETKTNDIIVHASITAKPFFEKRGFQTVKLKEVERHGVFLKNYIMIKNL
jgi:acetyltransferase